LGVRRTRPAGAGTVGAGTTGTTIVTFLMVFLIQNTQDRDSAAIQAELDEPVRTSAARNLLVGIERLTQAELEDIRRKCEERAAAEEGTAEADDQSPPADAPYGSVSVPPVL
jgi:low affinity Fe/Cu permease